MMMPLEGIRVIELTRVGPGAFCARMLGDMGAEVIKVEGPFRGVLGGMGREKWRRAAFDRNKKSLFLDLKIPEGLEVLHKLVGISDVVIEGFRPEVTKRLGADYETLSRINPRTIYCSLSGYGQTGPYKNLPGHDLNYIAIGGVLDLIGERGGRPVIPLNLIADYASATLHGVIGITMGLLAREKTGRGQYIDVSYVDGVISLLGAIPPVSEYLLDGKLPKRGEGIMGGAYPYYNIYETKEGGYIALGCIEHHFWDNLCRALNREDLASYKFSPEHFTSPPGEEWERVRRELEEIFRTRTRNDWFEFLSQHDIPISKVNNITEALLDPQIQERGMVQEVTDLDLGKVRQIGFPIKFSETPARISSATPYPGQHTLEILRSLGYNEAGIDELIQKKVIEVVS